MVVAINVSNFLSLHMGQAQHVLKVERGVSSVQFQRPRVEVFVWQFQAAQKNDRQQASANFLGAEVIDGRGGEDVDYLCNYRFAGSKYLLPFFNLLKEDEASLGLFRIISGEVAEYDVGIEKPHARLSELTARLVRSSLAWRMSALKSSGLFLGETEP